ncbi:Protein of unknown function [Belliella buryatensis]|uniref:DUF2975 domain-containing protein n=1 Tax=Belliella buryatensis TaxID=1500549 RepID=A0A239AJK1_9BACT|nr:DUF2975 domain-containing protein [Belliella buryatensis]SNR95158.1 Protein of unknown function [Belliella buryatensis]
MSIKNQWKEKWVNQPGFMLITVVIWSIFIGLCIKAGALIMNTTYSFFNPVVAKNLYEGLDLYGLLKENYWYYLGAVSFMIIIQVLKAVIFLLMIKIFLAINLKQPFSLTIFNLIEKISYVSLQVGILTIFSSHYFKWLAKRGFDLPPVSPAYVSGAFEYLFMAALIYALAQVFKRGTEIQSENELTV